MDRKQFFQLVLEVKRNIAIYTPEQKMRVLEKIEQLNKKISSINSNPRIVNESADFLEEK